MDHDNWVQIFLGLIGIGITITVSLMGILFSWLRTRIERNEQRFTEDIRELRQQVNDRLRSLGHEDREIRTMIESLWKIILEEINGRNKNGS